MIINIDDKIFEKASKLTGIKEKTQLLHEGLKTLIERESARRLTKLAGSSPNLNFMHKASLIFTIILSLYAIPAFAKELQKPNIVFILADDMSRDTWGVYGSMDCKTPNIDQLAKEGVVFERAYCSVAMCAPFRQELYSGRSPWRTRTLANHSTSTAGTKSLPHYLKPLGYRTALLGKSHVGPKACYPFEYLQVGKKNQGQVVKKNQGQNDRFVNQAKKFIEASDQVNKPFCLVIASNDSHTPFTTGDQQMYKANELTIPPYWIDTPELRETMVKYYAEITNFDHLVGRVRKLLEQTSKWENTLFIVCSEQGTRLPFAKWSCYDNGLRTGLIFHGLGLKGQAGKIDELVSIADIAPTLVELVGGTFKQNDFDGKSFYSLLKGESKPHHKYVYGAFTNCKIKDNRDRIFPIRVIRDKEFSLIFNPNYQGYTSNTTIMSSFEMLKDPTRKGEGISASWVPFLEKGPRYKNIVKKLHQRPEYELYHLVKDPYELENIIDQPEYKTVVERLKRELHQKLIQLGDADPIATERSLLVKMKGKK